jgi:hypothetical protein
LPSTRPTATCRRSASAPTFPRVVYLHTDIDPRAGEDIDAERQRALGLLRNPPGLLQPTCIIDSGGGYQGFWQLREPITTDCELAKAEDAKAVQPCHRATPLAPTTCTT